MTLGVAPNSKCLSHYKFALAMSYLCLSRGDAPLNRSDIETIQHLLSHGGKYYKCRRLYNEIIRRILTDGTFLIPTYITETTAQELGLDKFI
jgi:hypothetical protein